MRRPPTFLAAALAASTLLSLIIPADATVAVRPGSPGTAPAAVVIAEYGLPAGVVAPFGIAAGPRSSTWFGAGDYIGRIQHNGRMTTYQVPTPGANVGWVTAGPDSRLWFAERDGNKIATINADGSVTEVPVPTPDSGPLGMTLGPDGALWFTERNAEKIGRFDLTAKTFREYPLPSGSNPQRITVGGDDALWFTQFAANKIGRMTVDGQLTEFPLAPGSGPVGIIADDRGGIWFTLFTAARIGRMDLNGTITAQYNVPTPNSRPIQITVQPGRGTTVWFTEQGANQIGRLTTDQPRR